MILLHVTYQTKPEERDAFYRAICALDVPNKSRAEDGNLQYDYFLPIDTEDTLFLVEIWRDEEALAEHQKEAHFIALQELKSQYVLDVTVERYNLK